MRAKKTANRDIFNRNMAVLLIGTAIALDGPLAIAQQEEESAGGLQEIVVTAQRRSQSMQDVPIAINAFTGDELKAAGILTTEDLAVMTPGLQVTYASAGDIYLRGVGTGINSAGAEGSVAVYVDDVYYADSSTVLTSLANVERVEVLKGPQGTLYGRNATGGLIHIITPEPQAAGLTKLQVGYEDYDTLIGSLYTTGALTDQLKGSFSVDIHRQGAGFGENLTLHRDVNYARYGHARGKLLWQLGAADSVTFLANYNKDTSDLGHMSTFGPGETSSSGATYPGNPWDSLWSTELRRKSVMVDAAIKWLHTFGNGTTFKSTSAYTKFKYDLTGYDIDGDAPLLVSADVYKDYHTFEQEFLLQGNTSWLNHTLDYTTGFFYYNAANKLTLESYAGTFHLHSPADIPADSYAGFVQGDYGLTARDTVTVGLRYTADHQKANLSNVTVISGQQVGQQTGSGDASWSKLTWRLSLKHKFTDSLMVYGNYSRGYHSGLFNSQLSAAGEATPVNPEVLDAYDTGFKGTFLDRHLQLQFSGFYYDYKSLQVMTIGSADTFPVTNAGAAKIYGAEGQAEVVVPVSVGDLQLNVNAGYLHTKYSKFEGCQVFQVNAFPPGGLNTLSGTCSGNQLVFAPKYQATLGFNYTVPIPQTGGKVGVGMTYYHNDGYYYTPDNSLKQPAYDLLSAEVSYAFAHERARVRAYGRNLTNQVVRQSVARYPFGDEYCPSPPRVYGVAIEYRWD